MSHQSITESPPVDGRCRALLRHTGLHCTHRALHPLPVCGIHELAIRDRPDRHPPDLVEAVRRARRQQRMADEHRLSRSVALLSSPESETVVDRIEAALGRVDLIEQTAGPEVDDYALEIARRCAIREAVCRALMQIDQGRRERAGELRLVRGAS